MSEQQYRVIADRDKGDDPQHADIREGDRFTQEASEDDPDRLIRIERPVPTTDEQQRRFRVVDINQGVIDEGNNEVTFTLSELDEQPSPSLPTREQIASELYSFSGDWQLYRIPWSKQGHEGVRKALLDRADAVLTLLQKGAERG